MLGRSTLNRATLMSRRILSATPRLQAIGRHMSTNAQNEANAAESALVLFKENLASRTYILNRPKKLNTLQLSMLDLLRPKIEEWNNSDLCSVIIGMGQGRGFCAGGDVADVVQHAQKEETRSQALEFFKREFELDHLLATITKPYVVLMNGITMGGGVGLASPAPFRVATETTSFAMPETKIGYCPDVGASFFLSKLDGELGTYLALTGEGVTGRGVFEIGFATHYVPSANLPKLLDRLTALEPPAATEKHINDLLEEFSPAPESDSSYPFVGSVRVALDRAFSHSTVPAIIADLQAIEKENESERGDKGVLDWAKATLDALNLRSPTSVKLALQTIRRGKAMNMAQAMEMELRIATSCCSGGTPDFAKGVHAVLVEKSKDRPDWSPADFDSVSDDMIEKHFFQLDSPYTAATPKLDILSDAELASKSSSDPSFRFRAVRNLARWALPNEKRIRDAVIGSGHGSSDMSLTLDELVYQIGADKKVGGRRKVEEVVGRKCELFASGDGEKKWLKWKH